MQRVDRAKKDVKYWGIRLVLAVAVAVVVVVVNLYFVAMQTRDLSSHCFASLVLVAYVVASKVVRKM